MKLLGRTQMLSQYSILNSLEVIQQLGFDEVGFSGGMALDLYKYDYEAVASSSIVCLRTLLAQLKAEKA